MIAARYGYYQIAKLILSKCLNKNFVNSINDFGSTALHYVCINGNDKLCSLLIKAGADINKQDNDKNDSLMNAAENGHLGIVKILTEAGIDMKHKDKAGRNAIFFSELNGHSKISNYLKSQGMKIIKDKSGLLPSDLQAII